MHKDINPETSAQKGVKRNSTYCVIMAGGSGNHFWPVSRDDRPKQFFSLREDGKSLLRETYERFLGTVPKENILVVTLEKLKKLVSQEIPELPEKNLLIEPYGRKTGPCIAYATYSLLKRDPDAVMAVSPSDLMIRDG